MSRPPGDSAEPAARASHAAGAVPPGVPAVPPDRPAAVGAGWRWRLVGDDGLLVDLPDAEAVARVGAALRAAALDGVADVVPAARTVLVRGSARARRRWADEARRVAEGSSDTVPDERAPRLVEIPVVYDGDDLADVAALTGLPPDQVVARHVAGRYRVAFGGFMPGFAYLTGLDPELRVPRLATPRTRVPAGAVAIAGEYAAVYPRATPGGWRLLGRTDAVLFDPGHDERPALLAPGDEVRFVAAREVAAVPDELAEVAAGAASDGSASRPTAPMVPVGAMGGEPAQARRPGLEVLATGPLVLVEDAGRSGLMAVGVPRSGVADPTALRAANRLVGNRADAAMLEVVLGGLVVRLGGTTAVALVGAPVPADLDGEPLPMDRAVRAPAGSTLALGTPPTGLRTWLAVRGGVDVPPVLGSRSADVLSGLGPPPVVPGDVLPLGHAFDGLPELPATAASAAPAPAPVPPPVDSPTPVSPPVDSPAVPSSTAKPPTAASPPFPPDGTAVGGGTAAVSVHNRWVVELPATRGPRADRLTDEARARLAEQVWTVSADSNRVALRLDGPPLARARADELPSEGLVAGAVQVPHDGRPVVFGPDHPVTGGYPVVAVLTAEGLSRAAQCRPGDRVRLVVG